MGLTTLMSILVTKRMKLIGSCRTTCPSIQRRRSWRFSSWESQRASTNSAKEKCTLKSRKEIGFKCELAAASWRSVTSSTTTPRSSSIESAESMSRIDSIRSSVPKESAHSWAALSARPQRSTLLSAPPIRNPRQRDSAPPWPFVILNRHRYPWTSNSDRPINRCLT